MSSAQEIALLAARQALSDIAKRYAASPDGSNWAFLCESAETFAKAHWAMKAPAPRAGAHGLTIPFGKNKGTPLGEATEKDLRYIAGVVTESISDPAKSKWSTKNQELLEAIEAELLTR